MTRAVWALARAVWPLLLVALAGVLLLAYERTKGGPDCAVIGHMTISPAAWVALGEMINPSPDVLLDAAKSYAREWRRHSETCFEGELGNFYGDVLVWAWSDARGLARVYILTRSEYLALTGIHYDSWNRSFVNPR